MSNSAVCRIWSARLTSVRTGHLALLNALDLLNAKERERREQLVQAADRDRFTLGAALVRLAAATELGARPAELLVDRTCGDCPRWHGRPRLPDHGLHLSVSHSADVVTVATTRRAPVGIDVEEIRSLDYQPLLRHVLAPAESGTVHCARDFFVYWARKESALKATGDGLSTAMTELVVTLPSANAELLRYGAETRPAATMADLTGVGEDYAAALTLLARGPIDIDERDADELLLTL